MSRPLLSYSDLPAPQSKYAEPTQSARSFDGRPRPSISDDGPAAKKRKKSGRGGRHGNGYGAHYYQQGRENYAQRHWDAQGGGEEELTYGGEAVHAPEKPPTPSLYDESLDLDELRRARTPGMDASAAEEEARQKVRDSRPKPVETMPTGHPTIGTDAGISRAPDSTPAKSLSQASVAAGGSDVKQQRKKRARARAQSKVLTHEDIWDDSALIDAWNAAVEEYEMENGKGNKDWKTEPVQKSALYYNIPPTMSNEAEEEVDEESGSEGPGDDTENNSKPFDFQSYVPDHDASLQFKDPTEPDRPGPSTLVPQFAFGASSHGPVTKEEALQRAFGAWYWAGYWSGVYNSMNDPERVPVDEPAHSHEALEDDNDNEGDEGGGEDEGLLPAQR